MAEYPSFAVMPNGLHYMIIDSHKKDRHSDQDISALVTPASTKSAKLEDIII